MELKLVPLERKYLEFVRGVRNDPEVNKYLFTNTYISKEQQETWYKKKIRDRKSLILIALDDMPVGYCQINNIDNINQSCELGFYIASEHQGKDYGTILVKELINYATNKFNMHRLYLEVLADNDRAIRLYQNCGFIKEDILRDKIFKDGKSLDVVIMSMVV